MTSSPRETQHTPTYESKALLVRVHQWDLGLDAENLKLSLDVLSQDPWGIYTQVLEALP